MFEIPLVPYCGKKSIYHKGFTIVAFAGVIKSMC